MKCALATKAESGSFELKPAELAYDTWLKKQFIIHASKKQTKRKKTKKHE
jgi:hypothetical protein